jgi:hypothetical protein
VVEHNLDAGAPLLRLGLFRADPIWKPISTRNLTDLTMTSPISNGRDVAVKLDAGGIHRSMPLGVNMIYVH